MDPTDRLGQQRKDDRNVLTNTEKRYSNFERECLAVAYGLEKFEFYFLGRTAIIETGHSPLGQILKKKHQRKPWKTTKTPAEMLAIPRSGEIQTRKESVSTNHNKSKTTQFTLLQTHPSLSTSTQ